MRNYNTVGRRAKTWIKFLLLQGPFLYPIRYFMFTIGLFLSILGTYFILVSPSVIYEPERKNK